MTRSDALARAAQCEEWASATAVLERQTVLRYMAQLWTVFAKHANEFENVDAEYEHLIALEQAIKTPPSRSNSRVLI